MAAYIRDDIGLRLERGDGLPTELTIQALSQHYGVSFSPVRKAIDALIQEGLLRKKSNGRLDVVPVNGGQKTLRADRPLVPDDPVPKIAQDLVALSFQGEPVYLREEATASQYGLSRSSLRNVLHRLAGEGLIEHVPRKGWLVRPFDQGNLQAFIEVREVMELKAFDLAVPHLQTEEARQALQTIALGNIVPQSDKEPVAIDNSLHNLWIEKAANPYISDFFRRHGPYFSHLFDWEGEDRASAVEAAGQHRQIIAAILDGDWQTAREALSHHIRTNHPKLNP